MPASLTCTALRVIARRAGSGLPSYGDATFSDGKTYAFFRHPITGVIEMGDHRRRHGVLERYSFASPRRAAAVEAACLAARDDA